MRRLFHFLFLSLLVVTMGIQQPLLAQPLAKTNMATITTPLISDKTPDWARLMYSDAPNVFEVDDLYKRYYQTHPFEKNRDTRNYKHWRNTLERNAYIQSDGTIRVPSAEEWMDVATTWMAQKEAFDQQSQIVAPNSEWQQIGPYEIRNGTNTHRSAQACQARIAQCAAFPDVLYTVSESGMLFKTTNHGDTWSAISENYVFYGFTGTEMSLAVHPTDPNTVYFGTDNALYKTTDGGVVWTTLMSMNNLDPTAILINPVAPETIYFSGTAGIYKSTDGGANFTIVRAGKTWDIKLKTDDPNTLFAIARNGTKSDFYKSTDAGATWNASITGWFSNAQDFDGGGRMTVSTGNPNLLYCFILGRVTGDAVANAFVGIAKSTDGGSTWTKPVTHDNRKGVGVDYDFRVCAIEVSDADDNLVYFGNLDAYRTTDGLATVVRGPVSGQHEDQQQYMFNGPNDFWVLSDGGIDLYNSTLTSRVPKNKGLTATDFWFYSQGWNEDTRAGSFYHNGAAGFRPGYINNGNHEYLGFGSGEPTHAYVSHGNPGKMWFEGIIDGRSLPSDITGKLLEFSYSKYPNGGVGTFRRSELVIHPQYYNTHFLGKDNILWKSVDEGDSFTAQYTFGTNPAEIVAAIEISRANPQLMLVHQVIRTGSSVTGGKLWKSMDGGVTFTEIVQPAGASLPDGLYITMDPVDENVFWIAYDKTTSTHKVFKTIDGGATWINWSSSVLDGHLPKEILHIGGTDGGVYLMAQQAVFYRNNTHADWQPFSLGLPAKPQNRYLRPFYKEGQLRMATGNRGLYTVDFFEAPTTFIAQASVDKKNAYCQRDTFYYDDFSMVNHTGASWSWAFPGAASVSNANIRNPKVTYSAPGTYTATMTLTTPLGTQTSTVTVQVVSDCVPDDTRGMALRTTTNTDLMVTPDVPLGGLTHFTMTGWIKPNGAQEGLAAIFHDNQWCGACDDVEGLFFDYDAGAYLWYRWPGQSTWFGETNMAIPLGEWSYVALVITPTSATLYLNDQKFVDNKTQLPGYIDRLVLGGGAYNHRYKGDLDEMTFWKRALTDDEIWRLRHITKEDVIVSDPDLLAYYQFNDTADNGHVQDKVGTKHGILRGTAALVPSTAPVGGGVAQIKLLEASQLKYDFDQTGVNLTFSDCDSPSGKMVVSRIDAAPDTAPNANPAVNNYWVINHYKGNATSSFDALDSISVTPTDAGFKAALPNASAAVIHLRNQNGEGTNWTTTAAAKALTGDSITYNLTSRIVSATQLTLTNGAPAFTEVTPQRYCEVDTIPGQALTLNGLSGNYAEVSALNLNTNTLTISAWIKPKKVHGNAGIVFWRGGNTLSGLNFSGSNELYYHWDGGKWWLSSGFVLPVDEWSHVALVIEPTKSTIYWNGVAKVFNENHGVEPFDSPMLLGNDPCCGGRFFDGEMDEVGVWNRALSQSEIRELMHLTKEDIIDTDPNLKVYLQFNEESGSAYDKTTGKNNAILRGAASRVASNAPVGGGHSARQTVSGSGEYTFGGTGVTLGFPATGTYPNGEILVSRIHLAPDVSPNGEPITGENVYWAIHNFGSNANFTPLDKIVFDEIKGIAAPDQLDPSQFSLYKRASTAYGDTWGTGIDNADLVIAHGDNTGKIEFSTGNGLGSFSQFAMTSANRRLNVALRALLEGPYESGLLRDDLRSNDFIPNTEPFTTLGYPHTGGGGGETIPNSVKGTTGNDAIVDWVVIELRNPANPASVLYTRSALLQRDGDVVDIDGVSPVGFNQTAVGNYYVALRHRNHLGIMSATPQAFDTTPVLLNFSDGTAPTYGTNAQKDVAGVRMLWAGDANLNGQVQNTDIENDWKTTVGQSGYKAADFNLNGQVQNTDLEYYWKNNVGRGSQLPQ